MHIQDFYSDIWRQREGDFFHKAENGKLEAFTLYGSRGLSQHQMNRWSHETAHLIEARPEDIGCPTWGMDHWLGAALDSNYSRKQLVNREAALREMAVLGYQEILNELLGLGGKRMGWFGPRGNDPEGIWNEYFQPYVDVQAAVEAWVDAYTTPNEELMRRFKTNEAHALRWLEQHG